MNYLSDKSNEKQYAKANDFVIEAFAWQNW